jgi:hypothetical protein
MKKNTLLLCMLLSTLFTIVNAQNEKKIFKYIEEGNIEDATNELKKTDYSKGYKRKKLLLIQLGNILLLGNENYQSYEPVNACNLFKSLSISNLESIELNDFLADYSLNLNTISDLLYTNILNEAKKINTESSYDDALNICKPCKYEVEIKNLKVKAAYNACINKGTVEGYKYFIEKYSDTAYISDVTELLNKKAFEEAKTNMTVVSMNNYINSYSNSIYIKSAIDIRDSLALPKNKTDYYSLLKYTKEYPNSKFTPKIINVELPTILQNEALALQGRVFNFESTTDNNFCSEDSILGGDCSGGRIYFTKKGNVIFLFNCVGSDSSSYHIGTYKVTEKEVECKFCKRFIYSDTEPYIPYSKQDAVVKDIDWSLSLNKVECKSKIEYYFILKWDEGDELMVINNSDSLESDSFINSINEIKCESKYDIQYAPVNIEIDIKSYLQYLNDSYPNGLGNGGDNVEIKKIAGITYWVTTNYAFSNSSEIYWLLDKNQFIPKFDFYYSGIWTKELSYTFTNINESKTISGNVYGIDCGNKIEILKEKFITDAE